MNKITQTFCTFFIVASVLFLGCWPSNSEPEQDLGQGMNLLGQNNSSTNATHADVKSNTGPEIPWKSPTSPPESPEKFLRFHEFTEEGEDGTKVFKRNMNNTNFLNLFGFSYNEMNNPPSDRIRPEPTDEVGRYLFSDFDGAWYVRVIVTSVFPINHSDNKSGEKQYEKELEVSFRQKPRDQDMTPPVCPYCESPKCGCVLRHSPTEEPPICPCPTDVLRQDKPVGKEEEM